MEGKYILVLRLSIFKVLLRLIDDVHSCAADETCRAVGVNAIITANEAVETTKGVELDRLGG